MNKDINVCDCECHKSDNVMHIMACCIKCKCGERIRVGCMANHREKDCKGVKNEMEK